MSNNNGVIFQIKTQYVSSNTFEAISKQIKGVQEKAKTLTGTYHTQSKTIGQLKDKITEYRKAADNTYRLDHVIKYNQLIAGTKKKIDELEASAKTCKEKTQSIFGAVFGANLLTRGVGIAKSAVTGFANDSLEAYKKHNVARTQLEQVMKNTMGAGKWDVEDVVAVTKAQEKLGVVSSTVQLAGAKELGTYIKKKESLEKLIPTMNNMLAHQYGLNATQENAQGIAQMMGKVLEGQVNALSRNGYSFTEAQEKILKYGNESERVAVLMEVIAQSVSGVNEALAATPEGKVKQTAMEYEEVSLRVGELLTKLQGGTSNMFKGLVVSLYENRKQIVGISKAVTTGAVAWGVYTGVVKSGITWTKLKTAALTTKAFTVNVLTGKLNLATKATAAFNAVSKMNPIGLVTSALAAGCLAFSLFKKRNNESSDAIKNARETYSSFYAQERTQLDIIFAKLKQTNPKSEERKRLVKELAELYPELNKQTLDDITNTNNLAGAYDTLIAVIQKKAKTKAYESALETAYTDGKDGEEILRKKYPNLTDNQLRDKAQNILDYYKREGISPTFYKYGNIGTERSNRKKLQNFIDSRNEADRIAQIIGSESSGGTGSGGGSNDYTSTASDTITGGGKQVKNFYINIDSLIKENTNMFQSSSDDPQSAQGFISKLSETLQRVVNDVNYAAS